VQFPIICLITAGEGRKPGLVREAASAGVDLVQIREPLLQGGALVTFVRSAIDEAVGTSCSVLVNDRFDVAIAANAAGVHLRSDSVPAERIRRVAPPGFLVGRSVHDAAEAAGISRADGCDYLIFGTVFPSRSKPAGHPAAGVQKLAEVCRATTLPVIAVGGISVENAAEVIAAGAKGVAAIDLFRSGRPLSATLSLLRQRFDT